MDPLDERQPTPTDERLGTTAIFAGSGSAN
jgi:hypothetical protein